MAISVKKLTWALTAIIVLSVGGAAIEANRIHQIDAFNQAVSTGKTPQTDKLSLEAKYSVAYWLAKNERYKEAALLFLPLAQTGTPAQRAAIQHNVGNTFLLRALAVGGNNASIHDEVEYLLIQAKNAYKLALKQDNSYWGTRHNLDRVLSLLPDNPTPGVGESDSPGLIMGNIPVGLP